MKLIKQTTLHYQEGKSDKIYEVDLCEVGEDSYVVNFRYGRRGARLRENTKTPRPVSRPEADRIFDRLVTSKTRKGYQDVTSVTSQPGPGPSPVDNEARKQAVLNRLSSATQLDGADEPKGEWSLSRVIWRAGELKIREAAPLLIDLIGRGDELQDYCLVWALGWCGDKSAVSVLSRLYDDTSTPDSVRRIAAEAWLRLSDEAARAAFRVDLINKLPPELRDLARDGPSSDFSTALTAYLDTDDFQRFAVLDTIYLIDNENVHPALLDILRTAPLRPNYFQRLRHIFKAAEYRLDAEVFGLIAYRFETTREMFGRTYYALDKEYRWSPHVYTAEGGYVNARQEIQSQTAKIAYGRRTRTYLRKRVWRTLKRLGDLNDPNYVKMAVGVLRPYSDDDAQQVRETQSYHWYRENGRWHHQIIENYWDAYAPYWAFNHILYGNSPRYMAKTASVVWGCRPSYKPGDPAPDAREEAFQKLWEQSPAELLPLISVSNCQPVHEFAVKVLRDCQEFCTELGLEDLIMMLGRPYEVTARFAFELVQDRYQPSDPDNDLVLAVVNCAFGEARAQAQRWIEDNSLHFLADNNFVVALATSPYADTREFARKLLGSAIIPETVAKPLIAQLIAYLLTCDESQADLAADIAATVFKTFGPQLRAIGLEVVFDLLAHPLLAVQELGGHILLNHDTRADDLPEGIIASLIASPYEEMRVIGVQLFGQLADETLLSQENLIVAMTMYELPDIRRAIRPVVRRLGQASPAFAARLSVLFIQVLLQPEPHEGVHHDLMRLLREDLGEQWMVEATPEQAWDLLGAKSAAAQELGGRLIEFKVNTDESWAGYFEIEQIVELSNHEILAVRQAVQAVFMSALPRFQRATNPDHLSELAVAVRLLDSKWDDTRQFWFKTFRTHFTADDFTPGILVSICDSVREDVQKFGRDLITTYFEEEAGQEYLLKLSEHPTTDLQTFAATFLEGYAADSPARLKELKPYFISVLSRVNKARVAKNRVMAFLAAEAQKNEEAAKIVAEILTRQSVTIAIGDKATAIGAMLAIHRQYPHIPLPLQVKQPEVRYAV